METTAIIGLGSSLGFRERFICRAAAHLHAQPKIQVVRYSRLFKSLPLGAANGFFINAAVRIITSLSPYELLVTCKSIEQRMGRESHGRWTDRVIDLDILLYENLYLNDPELQIPHYALLHRSFALWPALDVGGDLSHPLYHKKLVELELRHHWPCWAIGAFPFASKLLTRYRSAYRKRVHRWRNST